MQHVARHRHAWPGELRVASTLQAVELVCVVVYDIDVSKRPEPAERKSKHM